MRTLIWVLQEAWRQAQRGSTPPHAHLACPVGCVTMRQKGNKTQDWVARCQSALETHLCPFGEGTSPTSHTTPTAKSTRAVSQTRPPFCHQVLGLHGALYMDLVCQHQSLRRGLSSCDGSGDMQEPPWGQPGSQSGAHPQAPRS